MKQRWEYGTMLQRHNGEIVMFVGWDRARGRMLGGAPGWFVGIRVGTNTVRHGSIPVLTPGASGNYVASQFTEVPE